MIDLQPFCSDDPERVYVARPFSFEGFMYATNGHIMVRVPYKGKPRGHIQAPGAKAAAMFAAPKPATRRPGRLGRVRWEGMIGVGEGVYQRRYIAMVLALPDVRIEQNPEATGPMYFEFGGGEGVLMPVTNTPPDHAIKWRAER